MTFLFIYFLSSLLIFSLIARSMWRPVCVLTTPCDLCAGTAVINPLHTCTWPASTCCKRFPELLIHVCPPFKLCLRSALSSKPLHHNSTISGCFQRDGAQKRVYSLSIRKGLKIFSCGCKTIKRDRASFVHAHKEAILFCFSANPRNSRGGRDAP